jgi:hypothetical protein
MRKLLVVLLVAALMPTAAYADVIGSWSEVSGATWDTFTLTTTPTGGTTFIGFDIAVFDTAYVDNQNFDGPDPGWNNSGSAFSTALHGDNNGYTHFMLRTAHGATTDLVTSGTYVDSGSLASALSYAAGGSYNGGWSSALVLLQIVVPHGEYQLVTSGTQLVSVTNTDWATAPEWLDPTTALHNMTMSNFLGTAAPPPPVPEPSTLTLLASGLIGLLAYAWKKRK